MSDPKTLELLGVIARQAAALEGIRQAIDGAMEKDVKVLNRSGNAAVMVAGLLDNYYTCLETVFVRISPLLREHHRDGAMAYRSFWTRWRWRFPACGSQRYRGRTTFPSSSF